MLKDRCKSAAEDSFMREGTRGGTPIRVSPFDNPNPYLVSLEAFDHSPTIAEPSLLKERGNSETDHKDDKNIEFVQKEPHTTSRLHELTCYASDGSTTIDQKVCFQIFWSIRAHDSSLRTLNPQHRVKTLVARPTPLHGRR